MVHGPYKLSSNNTNSFISDISCSHYSRVSCLPRGRIICKAGYYDTSHNGVSADTKMVAEDGIPAIQRKTIKTTTILGPRPPYQVPEKYDNCMKMAKEQDRPCWRPRMKWKQYPLSFHSRAAPLQQNPSAKSSRGQKMKAQQLQLK